MATDAGERRQQQWVVGSGSNGDVEREGKRERERERERGCRPEGSMSGSRPCTGDGADSSGSGDVEKGGKREEEREIERSERGGKLYDHSMMALAR